jgi:nicotinamidase/pyrazinamidase
MQQDFQTGDALIVVDIQNDFCPGGALGVPEGDQVIPVLNWWIERAVAKGIPVFLTRDWHPPNHISFTERGGPWPPHCVRNTNGAEFHPALTIPTSAVVVNKAVEADRESYSAFGDTRLAERLHKAGIKRIWIGGLALDYCVVSSTVDARNLGFDVVVLKDATRAVNVSPQDAARALERIRAAGAQILETAA